MAMTLPMDRTRRPRLDGKVSKNSLPAPSRPDLLLKVVVRRAGESWVVHALEHDFAAHGPTRDAALQALARTILAHFRLSQADADPLADVPPAPMEFWADWDSAPHYEEPRRIMSGGADHPAAYVSQAVLDTQPTG